MLLRRAHAAVAPCNCRHSHLQARCARSARRRCWASPRCRGLTEAWVGWAQPLRKVDIASGSHFACQLSCLLPYHASWTRHLTGNHLYSPPCSLPPAQPMPGVGQHGRGGPDGAAVRARLNRGRHAPEVRAATRKLCRAGQSRPPPGRVTRVLSARFAATPLQVPRNCPNPSRPHPLPQVWAGCGGSVAAQHERSGLHHRGGICW